jgi:hypothetical protein
MGYYLPIKRNEGARSQGIQGDALIFAGRRWLMPVILATHACDPSYSRGRNQEDCGSKTAWVNRAMRPYLKKDTSEKRAGGVAQSIGPVKPKFRKKKKKKKKIMTY